ncbi:RNA-binding S4 domain-containing protein [Campylobacter canadensis]|uniref:RNA-binding S4 domain-containing protein n=1 Tax=Campylobacter canadensis TaxID=449520 RepID=A0ABS7WP49_9BACT|nr:RNA-binding S4 domain-containing protein [Campylobacter canadensis]MBZ7986543.1 RNA-binding S4 domain-containing protein [Campylobacter canadensis]MBZ7994052.1 RNA-binding S4 domain-containing protein [Campylobacter canadensis]MBZ7995945.1 RNA-binding S4 domain-containing protein [Campylobacter canadensis]MBZ7997579.1 RNA-binding S4 domain-containing protein [Campylobacter canadensis]MBZ7999383.1 RNA-binding S4 domain-containing protein [Campylobacter canadensis]
MRVDKFLNAVNITKRRAISLDMCKNQVIAINGVLAKPSKEVKIGDIITLKLLDNEISYKVLALPSTKNIAKAKMNEYVEKL